jgi:hypothetical protein
MNAYWILEQMVEAARLQALVEELQKFEIEAIIGA